ncbi:MAG: DNA-3-methyladenine glycosylase I [Bacillati bacterium ANGP1]|uniref:DNA-3-methyladenine glycosylase I n=1 Tax=Candidatus Segetimicrobium genomatis TaxID=2569760 RepID=A0A537JVN7_9BACT|nr:MAG: DNA-3-methyladenine glycosylase I [Terrabacteria group bacterium ANGP1]
MKAVAVRVRCAWAEGSPLMTAYHDTEWGVPARDDRVLFEFLTLEGAQAGLNWLTILQKRHEYRAAFAGFDPVRVARFDGRMRRSLLRNPGIVRNRLKIDSVITNARAILGVQDEFGSLSAYLWRFVGGAPIVNAWTSLREIPSQTSESRQMSKEMKQRGFAFVGPTTCYAFMQAVGMVNDHVVRCFRYRQV